MGKTITYYEVSAKEDLEKNVNKVFQDMMDRIMNIL